MVASTARPPVSPVISWDKAQQQLRPVKKSNPLAVIAAVAMVLLVVTGIWRAVSKPAPGKFIQVMAAKSDIPAGTRLGIMSVRFFDVPKQYATPDMVTSLNDATGRIARTFIPAGEPIQNYMLFPERLGVSLNLDSSERAITLCLDEDAMVDHSINPDDRVDVLVVSNSGKKYTKTICQAVRVLMAAPKEQLLARHSPTATNKITLAVSPQMAETITEAAEVGKIRLVLRNRLSRKEQTLAGVSPDALLPESAKEPVVVKQVSSELVPPPPVAMPSLSEQIAQPLQWMVEVISGNKKENYGVPQK